jgi:hypothetical protein
MGRLLTGIAGALGLAWLWRHLRKEHGGQQPSLDAGLDPAEELRAKLAEAREAADDRDDYDAAEGQPVDEVERPPHAAAEPVPEAEPDEPTLSLDERRRAIHEKAQQALGEMNRPGQDD